MAGWYVVKKYYAVLFYKAMSYNLKELIEYAEKYQFEESKLPIAFTDEPYTRTSIYKDDKLEVVVICFADGQTSSVHHHQGSNCVVRVVRGKVLETLFDDIADVLELESNHVLKAGDISGLDGKQIHQLSNMSKTGTVLLNFYSPPFKV